MGITISIYFTDSRMSTVPSPLLLAYGPLGSKTRVGKMETNQFWSQNIRIFYDFIGILRTGDRYLKLSSNK